MLRKATGALRLGRSLCNFGHKLRIINLHRDEAIPVDLEDVDGVISMGGPQRPSFGTLHVDKAFGFRSVTWVQPGNPALNVNYVLEGDTIVATATKGDEEPEIQRLDLPDDWVISGPSVPSSPTGPQSSG